jgi:hypothetical protein
MRRLDRLHREAIPLILDQMEGLTPQAVPSLCVVPNLDVSSATITNSDHPSMFYLLR